MVWFSLFPHSIQCSHPISSPSKVSLKPSLSSHQSISWVEWVIALKKTLFCFYTPKHPRTLIWHVVLYKGIRFFSLAYRLLLTSCHCRYVSTCYVTKTSWLTPCRPYLPCHHPYHPFQLVGQTCPHLPRWQPQSCRAETQLRKHQPDRYGRPWMDPKYCRRLVNIQSIPSIGQ